MEFFWKKNKITDTDTQSVNTDENEMEAVSEDVPTAETVIDNTVSEPVVAEPEPVLATAPSNETVQPTSDKPVLSYTGDHVVPAPVIDPEAEAARMKAEEDSALAKEEKQRARRDKKMTLLHPGDIFWSWVLMSIPVIGWIVAILWSLGLCGKRQRKYLARAFLSLLLVKLIIIAVVFLFYKVVFRLDLEDLPTVLTSIYNWTWDKISRLFGN